MGCWFVSGGGPAIVFAGRERRATPISNGSDDTSRELGNIRSELLRLTLGDQLHPP
ncbi:MAG: hypothetical protein R2688_08800 [Fimbriimonadaceae bacterium]